MTTPNFIQIPALQNPTKDRFDATVMEVRGDEVLLDMSFFYPNLSAQPCDTGKACWENTESTIRRVEIRGGQLWHSFTDDIPAVGVKIHFFIDWPRRKLMSRLHTAAVLISGIVRTYWHCDVSSCGLSADGVRLDFACARKPESDVQELLSRCNAAIRTNAVVSTCWIPVHRAEEHVSLYRSAATSRKVQNRPGRVVQIGNNGSTIERQFDIGTHVQNIGELGEIFLGPGNGSRKKALENKGKNHFRVRFHLSET